VIFTPNPTPLRIKASELALLAPFAEVPSALSSMITDRASLTAHLSALPLLVMMSGDAMARKAIADAEAEAERKAITDAEAEAARIAQVQAASLAEQDLPQE
jgi:regulator of protease activity HflC (stomatin/prohibitin superfamily)